METNMNKESGFILDIVKTPFCSITVLATSIVIAILICRQTVNFCWAYIAAPKLFWSIFLTALLWDIYLYIIYWIIILFRALKK